MITYNGQNFSDMPVDFDLPLLVISQFSQLFIWWRRVYMIELGKLRFQQFNQHIPVGTIKKVYKNVLLVPFSHIALSNTL